jgi:hypothetical protein
VYDVVFDTPRGARSGDSLSVLARRHSTSVGQCSAFERLPELAVRDSGAGVDPVSLQARIDGNFVPVTFGSGRARLSLAGDGRGRHTLSFTAADYQETKNMENVARILPNTRTVRTTFLVP